jgi:hypothetical protein
MALIPPVSAARSVSARIRSLSAAVKIRRRGRSGSSGEAAAGAATIVGLRPWSVAAPATTSSRVGSMGISEVILPRHQV